MITLREITMDNFHDVINIKITDEDKHMVASNTYSLAEAFADKVSVPRAIYKDQTLIGFIMYDYNQKNQTGYISRLMISTNEQGKGYGTAALNIVVNELKSIPNIKKIEISYFPSNDKARKSYAKVGFIETDEIDDGELVAKIDL